MANKPSTALSPEMKQFPRQCRVMHGSLNSDHGSVMEVGDFVAIGSDGTYVQIMSADSYSLRFIGVANQEHTSTEAETEDFQVLEAGHGDEFEFSLDAVTTYRYGDRFKFSARKTLVKIAIDSRSGTDNALLMSTKTGSKSTVEGTLLIPAQTGVAKDSISILGNQT